MIEYLPQAISSLSAAKTIISSLLELRDINQINSKAIELQNQILTAHEKIFAAQQQQSLLTARIQELEKECMSLKDWSAEKERYDHKQIATGIFAYVDNKHIGNTESAHKLCCNCFGKNVKSTLQQGSDFLEGMGRIKTLICPNGCPRLEFTHYISSSPRSIRS